MTRVYSGMLALSLVGFCLGVASGADDSAVVTETRLSTGILYIPAACRPVGEKVAFVVHFHGSPEFVRDRFLESGKNAILVAVSFKGLSRAYSTPFKDRKLFRKILGEASRRTADHYGLKRVSIGKLVLSSFSAGYGAIREILKSHEYQVLVSDVVLADSLYAGYVNTNRHNRVDPDDMRPFVIFARRAAKGEAAMWLTHSEVIPPDYASTKETADFLIQKVSAKRVPASGDDASGLKLTSRADLGGFHVRGYAGETGEDHMRHLHSLAVWLARTSLDPLTPR